MPAFLDRDGHTLAILDRGRQTPACLDNDSHMPACYYIIVSGGHKFGQRWISILLPSLSVITVKSQWWTQL